jgi:hypothetical protein
LVKPRVLVLLLSPLLPVTAALWLCGLVHGFGALPLPWWARMAVVVALPLLFVGPALALYWAADRRRRRRVA